jgi:hypothetical protein
MDIMQYKSPRIARCEGSGGSGTRPREQQQ